MARITRDREKVRRRPARPLRVEALETRWVPAATGTLMPAAAVVSSSYSNTGSGIVASSVSEAGGYVFAQDFRVTMAPTSNAIGGPFTANDALNQFFDELMGGVDAYRRETLFGGAYNAIGVGPNGTLLPTATVEDQRFFWRGSTLVFSETLISGGEQYQVSYSQRIGRGGRGGGVVTAVEAADQFFASIASAGGDTNFPGLPGNYVLAHLGGGTGGTGSFGTTTTGITTGTTNTTTGSTTSGSTAGTSASGSTAGSTAGTTASGTTTTGTTGAAAGTNGTASGRTGTSGFTLSNSNALVGLAGTSFGTTSTAYGQGLTLSGNGTIASTGQPGNLVTTSTNFPLGTGEIVSPTGTVTTGINYGLTSSQTGPGIGTTTASGLSTSGFGGGNGGIVPTAGTGSNTGFTSTSNPLLTSGLSELSPGVGIFSLGAGSPTAQFGQGPTGQTGFGTLGATFGRALGPTALPGFGGLLGGTSSGPSTGGIVGQSGA